MRELSLHSVVQTTAAGTINIFRSDTGYNLVTGPHTMTAAFTGTISAPAGSSITLNSYVNTANLAPDFGPDAATPVPLAAVANLPAAGSFAAAGPGGFTVISTGTPVTFAELFNVGFNAGSPASLTASVTVSFVGGGGRVEFTDHQSITAVPVPATIALLVLGLTAMARAVAARAD